MHRYGYGDTRPGSRPSYDDDDRAAVWTLRLLAVGVFVIVVAGALVLSLRSLHGGGGPKRAAPAPVEAVTRPTVVTDLGPLPGVDVGGYVQNRKQALAAAREDRVAVVSLAKYSTEAQAKAVAGSTPPVALLVAPPGTAPAVVTTDLATWAKAQTEATRSERDEIKKLLPTVDDPAFKSFYTAEVDRLDKALKNFAPDSAMVFGVVVRAPATALQALGAKAEVRLVDVADLAQADPKAVYRGLRPEELAKANEPAVRPL